MKEYPKEHKTIVDALTAGQFILYSSTLHTVITDLQSEYTRFFKQTFNFSLVIKAEYIYLTTDEKQENESRNFLIFLALLSRELNISGKSFKDEIEFKSFHVEEVHQLLSSSVKKDLYEVVLNASNRNIGSFLKKWRDRNVIEFKNSNQTEFKFTPAVKLFFEYASILAEHQLKHTAVAAEKIEDEEDYEIEE
jgi:hypothetical protein